MRVCCNVSLSVKFKCLSYIYIYNLGLTISKAFAEFNSVTIVIARIFISEVSRTFMPPL